MKPSMFLLNTSLFQKQTQGNQRKNKVELSPFLWTLFVTLADFSAPNMPIHQPLKKLGSSTFHPFLSEFNVPNRSH
jgi:hypothetical protein